MKEWKAELALFFMTFVWGGTFLFTKIGLEYSSPSVYIIIRFSIALTISLIFFGKNLLKLDKKLFWQGIVLGLFFGGGFLLQTLGLKHTSVSKSAFITGVCVVLTPLVYRLVEGKHTTIWQKIGVVIVAVGLWIFSNPDFNNLNIGDVLTLISSFFWAFYITYMDVFTRDRKSRRETSSLVMLQFIAAAPIAILYNVFFEYGNFEIHWTREFVVSLAYNGILASFFVTFIHTSVQKFTSPVKAALIFSLEPIVASGFAMLVFAEFLNIKEYFGAVLLIVGVLSSEVGAYLFPKSKKALH